MIFNNFLKEIQPLANKEIYKLEKKYNDPLLGKAEISSFANQIIYEMFEN